jgi:adenine-specific DNA-methyltransferase
MRAPTARERRSLRSVDPFSGELEERARALVATEDRRQRGQVFTPWPIACLMAAWVSGCAPTRALDPACGLGVFTRALRARSQRALAVTLSDLDPQALALVAELAPALAPFRLRIVQEDFLRSDWERYDAVLCNPPYLKHHLIPDKRSYQRLLAERAGVRLPLTSNLYAWFLAKALQQLAPGGRMAFITPSEFLNANYGVALKRHLLASGCWRYLLFFEHAELVFSDALTTACITLFERPLAGAPPAQELTVLSADAGSLAAVGEFLLADRDGQAAGEELRVRRLAASSLDPGDKWSPLLRADAAAAARRGAWAPFRKYAQAKRGIATGDNSFFTLSERQVVELGIPKRYLVPCLTRAAHASSPLLDRRTLATLAAQGERIYLLYLRGDERHPALARYLAEGERRAVNERYLTRQRSPWWAMERKPAPDIFLAVFARGGVRVSRNEAGARSLACCHGIYVKRAEDVELVMAWLLTEAAAREIAGQRREYGGGLHKLEPNDLNRTLMPDLERLGGRARRTLLAAYAAWRRALLGGDERAARAQIGVIERAFASLAS